MKSNFIKRNVNQYVERTDWLPLALESVAAIVVGIMLLVSPQNATLLIAILIGLFWLIRGIAWVLSIFRDRKEWGWRLAGGILSIFVGALVLAYPLESAYLGAAVAVWIVAGAAFVAGIILVIRGFSYAGWGQVLLGFLCMALGFLLVLRAPTASFAVPWLTGLLVTVAGGAGVLAALRKRARKQ